MSGAQPTALEIPVTIQGATLLEGTDQRQLFTETSKTTVVFDNGAVVNLKAKLAQGQCVFLRNEKSGREILCRVLEWRPGGQGGYTDLEFTSRDPEFWSAPAQPAEQPARITPQPSENHAPASEASVAAAHQESSARSEAAIPSAPAAGAATTLDPPPLQAPRENPDSANDIEWDGSDDGQMLAAMMAGDAKPTHNHKRASEVREAAETEREALPEDAPRHADASPETVVEGKAISKLAVWVFQLREFKEGRKAIAVGVAACVLLAGMLGVALHVKHKFSLRAAARAAAASAQSAGQAQAASQGGPASAAPSATSTNNSGAMSASATPKAPPAVIVDQSTTNSPSQAQRGSVQPNEVEAKRHLPGGFSRGETIPARIISQEPPAVPSWAKKLDLDPVVRLDAVIDAQGNLTHTRPISGPRLLQGEAQRAVALWIFEPALLDGKPTATHMVLTVEFQR